MTYAICAPAYLTRYNIVDEDYMCGRGLHVRTRTTCADEDYMRGRGLHARTRTTCADEDYMRGWGEGYRIQDTGINSPILDYRFPV